MWLKQMVVLYYFNSRNNCLTYQWKTSHTAWRPSWLTSSLRSRSNPPPQSGYGCRKGTRSWAEKNEIDDFWKIDSRGVSQNLVCETALEEVPNIVVIRSSGENNNCSCSKARNKMEKIHLNMETDINYLSWVTAIPKLVSLFFGITTSNCSKLFKVHI